MLNAYFTLPIFPLKRKGKKNGQLDEKITKQANNDKTLFSWTKLKRKKNCGSQVPEEGP